MAGRPNYVPSTWSGRYSFNRWLAERPQRVLGWFVGATLFAFGLIAWAVTDPHGYFDGALAIPGLIGAGLLVVQAIVYIPRALRAMRGNTARR